MRNLKDCGDGKVIKIGEHKVVTVHPFADQLQLLKRVNISPEDCQMVDLYWEYRDQVYLVSLCNRDLLEDDQFVGINYSHRFHSFFVKSNKKFFTLKDAVRVLNYLRHYLEHTTTGVEDRDIFSDKFATWDQVENS